MTSRFERRLAQIEKLQRLIPEPPPDPRMFVIATLVGFHCCPRRDDEHPLKACAAVARGSSGDADAAMQRQFDDFLAAHRVNLDAEPTLDGLRALQRLLDGAVETVDIDRRLRDVENKMTDRK